jgi:hypothetical protein
MIEPGHFIAKTNVPFTTSIDCQKNNGNSSRKFLIKPFHFIIVH